MAPRRRCRGAPDPDIVDDARPGQQARFLEHDTARALVVVRILGANTAGTWLLEPDEKPQQGTLAAAAATDNRDERASLNPQIDVVENAV